MPVYHREKEHLKSRDLTFLSTTSKDSPSPDAKSRGVNHQTHYATVLSALTVGVVIVAAAFRNALLHEAQSFWVASGDFIANQWGHVYDYFEGDLMKIIFAFHAISVLELWVLGGLFLISDLTGRPAFITKYKVQADQPQIPPDKLRRLLWTVVTNQTIYSLPILFVLNHVLRWRGCGVTVDQLPTFSGFLLDMIVFVLVEEIGFYYSHRLLHHPSLYKAIHKQHHEWTAPVGLVALYSHPLENFLSNSLPIVIGPILMGSHILTMEVWILVALSVTTVTHSGYHLPFMASPEFHDFHHFKFTNNFGVLGFLDWLHGTDAHFRKTKQFKRHFTLISFTPVKELIPD